LPATIKVRVLAVHSGMSSSMIAEEDYTLL
jgi:hypothetical protein